MNSINLSKVSLLSFLSYKVYIMILLWNHETFYFHVVLKINKVYTFNQNMTIGLYLWKLITSQIFGYVRIFFTGFTNKSVLLKCCWTAQIKRITHGTITHDGLSFRCSQPSVSKLRDAKALWNSFQRKLGITCSRPV